MSLCLVAYIDQRGEDDLMAALMYSNTTDANRPHGSPRRLSGLFSLLMHARAKTRDADNYGHFSDTLRATNFLMIDIAEGSRH